MPNELHRRCAIAVMAKAPRLGRVKTRLCPPLLPDEACELSAAFLRDITENIRVAALDVPIDGWVAYAPAGDERAFDGILAEGTNLTLADGSISAPPGVEGFGRCLLHAVRTLLAQGYGAAVVLNADSPTLPTATLRDTADALLRDGDRAVLGAADDGGYYLLGLKRPLADPFSRIEWSTNVVAAQTRERVLGIGLDLIELPSWYDVDNEPALRRMITEIGSVSNAYPAPATAACVERQGLATRLFAQ